MTHARALKLVCDYAEARLNGADERTVILISAAIAKLREHAKWYSRAAIVRHQIKPDSELIPRNE